MPIYAYMCESCGHRQDVLQKVSDPVLSKCPACAASSFVKQVTAAGFQLKGSGWYATDFRGGAPAAPDKADATPDSKPADTAAPATAPAAASPATAPAASEKARPPTSEAA
jgi:putative FmdB family regulatory protein